MVELVQRLHAGQIDPAALSIDERQRCVGQLTLDGFATSEIAELMRLSLRTVQRDLVAIRQQEALKPERGLGDELLGKMERLTMASVQRLTRMARDPATPAYLRPWAEEASVRIYQRFLDAAARFSYFEDGRTRLARQRAADPAEQAQRRAEELRQLDRARQELADAQRLLAPLTEAEVQRALAGLSGKA